MRAKNHARLRRESQSGPVEPALIFALTPLSRVLVRGGFGVGTLIHAVKVAYVQAAIGETTPKGGRVNVSRLAVMTGLTRKEIASVLSTRAREPDPPRVGRIMEHRAQRILRGWKTDPFFQMSGGRPATLELRGDRCSFPALVKRYGGDVTPRAVLHELERIGAVTLGPSGRLQLKSVATASRDDVRRRVMSFGRLLGDFSSALHKSVTSPKESSFLGFMDSKLASPGQAALFQRVFARRASVLLESADQWIVKNAAQRLRPGRSGNRAKKTRVGIGIYLVDQVLENQRKKIGP